MLKQIARRILRKELKEQEEKAIDSFIRFRNIISSISFDKESGMKFLEQMVKAPKEATEENSNYQPIYSLTFEPNAADLFFVEDGDILPSGVKISVYPPKVNDEDWMYLSEMSIILHKCGCRFSKN